jgi:hypothetical protein
MNDYGIRISFDGKDVKTCSDLDTVVNSKYSNLKGSITGKGNSNVNGTVTVTIAHGLGYIPMLRVISNLGSQVGTTPYYQVPMDNSGTAADNYVACRADANNCYIDFTWNDFISGTTTVYSYAYWIFIDKGNLN